MDSWPLVAFGILTAMYVGLWVAELYYAESHVRWHIIAESIVVLVIVGLFAALVSS